MHDEFLAIRAATDLRRHAAHLRRRWDDSFARGLPTGVRSVIAESWTRMLGDGLAPDLLRPRSAGDEDALASAREESPLRLCLEDLRGSLAAIADDAEHIMVVADEHGTLLWIEGHERVLDQARAIDFVPGMTWTEDSAGTNAIGTALAIDHAVQVFSAEHFLSDQHPWWCSAAPIHDPATGDLLGVVDISGPQRTAHPHSLALVTAAASIAERTVGRRTADEAAQRARAADRRPRPHRTATTSATRWRLRLLTGDTPLLARPGAGDRGLSQRHAEVLALLAVNPGGLTAEQLTLRLYGEIGNPVTTRALVSRLRDVAGPVLETRPYRLRSARIRTDLVTLLGLLERGDAHAALAMYPGPLLPTSTAPGIEVLRREVDLAVRALALAGDADLLWRWLATTTGSDDLAALERFATVAADDDPRRALATARLAVVTAGWAAG